MNRLAALLIVSLGLGLSSAVVALGTSDPTAESAVVDLTPPRYERWLERSHVPAPPGTVYTSNDAKRCVYRACVAPQDEVVRIRRSYTRTLEGRHTWWHEVGHVYHLRVPEVQALYAERRNLCEGTFSYRCAELFADDYRNCAAGRRLARRMAARRWVHPATARSWRYRPWVCELVRSHA